MFKHLIIRILGRRRIEFLRSKPFFVNGKYRYIITDLEKYSDIIRKSYGSDPSLSLLLVRKFGHILDKGLNRIDVEKGHGKAVAEDLSRNIAIAEKDFSNDRTLKWAQEKLIRYNGLQFTGKLELPTEKETKINIHYSDLFQLIRHRRSNRSFDEKTIGSDIIEKLTETVNWAPSSCNKQPILIFATTNPIIAKKCLECCKGGTGFNDFIPSFVVLTADMRGYYLPEEAYLPYIDVALGAQNFFLAAETLSLSTCSLSWALKDQNDEMRLRKLLSIPDYAQIILNFALGFPSKVSEAPARKDLSNTLFIRNA
jgi:nitroreductase